MTNLNSYSLTLTSANKKEQTIKLTLWMAGTPIRSYFIIFPRKPIAQLFDA